MWPLLSTARDLIPARSLCTVDQMWSVSRLVQTVTLLLYKLCLYLQLLLLLLLFSEMAEKLVLLAIDVLREAFTTHQTDAATHRDTSGGGSDGPTENGQIISDEPCERSLCGRQLLYTARSMFEMFASLVPVYHRNVLNTVPQFAGNTLKTSSH